MWIPLLWLIPFFVVQTTLHEGAHALVARLFGAKILSFKIWPHRAPDGRFFWGRVTWSATPMIAGWRRAAIALAPYALGLVTIPGAIALGAHLQEPAFLVFAGAAGVDFVRGVMHPVWSDRGDLQTAIAALTAPSRG